jgi:DNA-binding NarL/FixJ family response regulator
MCRVLIADDVEAIRDLWRYTLQQDSRVEVVGTAATGAEALEGVMRLRPDVLVLDLSMPDRDGLEVIPSIRTASPETAIVVASGFAWSRMAPVALELGAASYFEKGRPIVELRQLVAEAHAARPTSFC